MSILNALNLPQSKQLLYIHFYPLENHRRSNGGVFRYVSRFFKTEIKNVKREALRESIFLTGFYIFFGSYDFVIDRVVIFKLIFGERRIDFATDSDYVKI